MRKKLVAMLLAAVMTVGLLPLSACSGGQDTTATTMHLWRTEGTVAVSDGSGKDVPVLNDLGLYSGYGVGTQSMSYAWIDLDDVKLTKMDQNSEISIEKDGKRLDIELKSGSLYFNVTQPLEDDETMNIHTSTMLVGIRGTSGWVEERSGLSRVYILEGTVECSAEGRTVQVSAWEYAELTADGNLVVEPFAVEDIPAFVQDDAGPDLIAGPDETPEPTPTPTPEPTPTPTPEPTPTPTLEPTPTPALEPTPTPTPESTPTPTPEPTGGDPSSPINLTISGGNYSVVNEHPAVVIDSMTAEGDWAMKPVSLDGCFALSQDSQLTVSNLAGADEDCYIAISLYTSTEGDDGVCYLDSMYPLILTNNGGFIPIISDVQNPEYGGIMYPRPSESATFSISEYAAIYDEETGEEVFTFDLLVLSLVLIYPETGQSEQVYYGFVY